MSLLSLPNEMITQVVDFLDDSDPQQPIDYDSYREMIRAVKALRLTCKLVAEIAFPHLLRTYCLLPSSESWVKLCGIVSHDVLRRHVETITLEKHNEGTQNYREEMKSISDDMRYCNIDLSLFPKLKVFKAEDKWLVTKKPNSKVRIPRGRCALHAASFTLYHMAIWSVLGNLTKVSTYGFEFVSLNCHLGYNGPWKYLLDMDFSKLKYLRLATEGLHANRYQSNLYPDIGLLQRLRRLPNLEEFHLNQFFSGREEDSTVNFTTDVLYYLQKKDWPRLRRLDLRFLTTTVADFETFVAPYAGKLARFQMHSNLVCPGVTKEEKEQRYFLPHWIRTFICLRGVGTTFEHYGVQPEEFYQTPEDFDQPVKAQAGDVDGEDIIMGDYDDDAEFIYFQRDFQGDIIMVDL